MLDSIVFYVGALTVVAGAAATPWRRHRRRAFAAMSLGAVASVAALFWPASERRAPAAASHLDEIMPVWEFGEFHAVHVDASRERTFDAMQKVTADEIQLFRTLTSIRRFGRPAPPGILNAPKDEPILSVATRTSFRKLAEEAPREIVVGTRVGSGTLAVMNFLVTSNARGGVELSTETRVHANTAGGRRAFAIYWRIIHPGSDIIRRMWLRAIRRRAEHDARPRAL